MRIERIMVFPSEKSAAALPSSRKGTNGISKNMILSDEESLQVRELAALDTDGNISAEMTLLILGEYQRRLPELQAAGAKGAKEFVRLNVKLDSEAIRKGKEIAALDTRGDFSLAMGLMVTRAYVRRRLPVNGHNKIRRRD